MSPYGAYTSVLVEDFEAPYGDYTSVLVEDFEAPYGDILLEPFMLIIVACQRE